MPVRVNTTDRNFLGILQNRYAGYLTSAANAEIELDIEMATPGAADPHAPVRVAQCGGRWTLTRGDFRAEWEPAKRRGWIRQTANPYSIDAVLRTRRIDRKGWQLLLDRLHRGLCAARQLTRNRHSRIEAALRIVRDGHPAFEICLDLEKRVAERRFE